MVSPYSAESERIIFYLPRPLFSSPGPSLPPVPPLFLVDGPGLQLAVIVQGIHLHHIPLHLHLIPRHKHQQFLGGVVVHRNLFTVRIQQAADGVDIRRGVDQHRPPVRTDLQADAFLGAFTVLQQRLRAVEQLQLRAQGNGNSAALQRRRNILQVQPVH